MGPAGVSSSARLGTLSADAEQDIYSEVIVSGTGVDGERLRVHRTLADVGLEHLDRGVRRTPSSAPFAGKRRRRYLASRHPNERTNMARTKAQRSAAGKKAAATRKRNATKKSAQDVKSSARSTSSSAVQMAKAAGSTVQGAAKSIATRADAARGGGSAKRKKGTRKKR